jgi:hypothetical protein
VLIKQHFSVPKEADVREATVRELKKLFPDTTAIKGKIVGLTTMIFALPFCMTKASVIFHGSFGFVALVGSQTHRTGRLLYKSNFGSLPGTAGGSPINL